MIRIIFVCFLFLPFTANAGTGWSQAGIITEVYNIGYTVMVRISGEQVDHSGGHCSKTGYYAINNDGSHQFNSIYSQILASFASGKNVVLWIDGNNCAGQHNEYQKLVSIRTFS